MLKLKYNKFKITKKDLFKLIILNNMMNQLNFGIFLVLIIKDLY